MLTDCNVLETLFKSLKSNENLLFCSLFLYSDTYVFQLLEALSFVAQLETKSLVSEAAVFLNLCDCDFLFRPDLYLKSSRPEKSFRHLCNQQLLERFENIAAVISKYASHDLIVSHLTRNIQSAKRPRESLFLLNLMVSQGLSGQDLLLDLTQFYLDLVPKSTEIEKVPSSVADAEDEKGKLEWSQRLLVMDGLAAIAKSMSVHFPTAIK